MTSVTQHSHDSSDVSVRLAWGEDAASIASVQIACWEGVLGDSLALALDADEVAATWHQALTRPPEARSRVLVALDRNRVVGFVVLIPGTDPDCDPIRDGEIAEWQVLPAERGHGHGSRLLQAAVDTLVADRFTRALTWLMTSDEARMRFLREAGWAADGAHRELASDDDTRMRQVRWHTAIGDRDPLETGTTGPGTPSPTADHG
jgi:GNAT superfamily N-acetyltransferase